MPEGRVTFLFTDVESSTRLLEQHPAEYGHAIARHHDLLAGAVERRGGVVFETIGDAVYAAFSEPAGAVEAATEAQLALRREDWGRWARSGCGWGSTPAKSSGAERTTSAPRSTAAPA